MLDYVRYYFNVRLEFFDINDMFNAQFPVKTVEVYQKGTFLRFNGTELEETLSGVDRYLAE